MLDPAPVVILDTPETAAAEDIVTEWAQELTRTGKAVITTTHESSMLADSAHHTATLTEGTLQWD